MTGEVPRDVLYHLLDALPVEISFIDAQDTVRYFNKPDTRIFRRPPSVIGMRVQQCHPKKSLPKVERILTEFREGKRDVAEFWIDHGGRKVYIRYFAVRDEEGNYLGTLEATEDITDIQKITGEKRLLD